MPAPTPPAFPPSCHSSVIRASSWVIRHSAAAVIALILSMHSAAAADWPQFLGPQRSGVADAGETLAAAFPPTGPRVIWTHPLGSGFAGPVVAQGKVIVFHRVEDAALVQALDVKNGNVIWRFSYENKFRDSFGFDNGPRACPTVAQGKVILHGAEGMIHVLDLADGRLLWSYDTVKEAASPQGFFGRVCTPIVVGDKVILTAGGKTAKGAAGIIALNLADGTPAWQGVEDEASCAAPILLEAAGWPALICWMRNQLTVCDARDGTVKSQQPLRSKMDASVNAATPIWCGEGLLFTTASYNVGASLWKWDPAGRLARVWKKDDVLDCHYSTPVHHNGHLYGFHGRQEFGQNLRCVRVADGKVMWESGRLAGGTLLRVQDTLLVLTEAGELWMVDAIPDKFHRRAQGQIMTAGHRSHAAFANGIFFARDGKQLVAVDLRPEGE